MDNQEHNLLEAATIAAQQLGLGIDVLQLEPQLGPARAHALVRVQNGGQEILYAAEVKPGLRPATIGAVINQLEHVGQRIPAPPALIGVGKGAKTNSPITHCKCYNTHVQPKWTPDTLPTSLQPKLD